MYWSPVLVGGEPGELMQEGGGPWSKMPRRGKGR